MSNNVWDAASELSGEQHARYSCYWGCEHLATLEAREATEAAREAWEAVEPA